MANYYKVSTVVTSGVFRISKGGAHFRWPLVLTQRGGGKPSFSNFFSMSKKNCLTKGGGAWHNATPKYASVRNISINTNHMPTTTTTMPRCWQHETTPTKATTTTTPTSQTIYCDTDDSHNDDDTGQRRRRHWRRHRRRHRRHRRRLWHRQRHIGYLYTYRIVSNICYRWKTARINGKNHFIQIVLYLAMYNVYSLICCLNEEKIKLMVGKL